MVSVMTSSMAIPAEAMKVPFWYEPDPVTGELIYIDHFNTMKYVDIPITNSITNPITNPTTTSITPQETPDIPEREGYIGEIVMVESTVKETKYVTIGELGVELGLFQNPNFPVKQTVTKVIYTPTIKWTPVEPEPIPETTPEIVVPVDMIEPVLSVLEPAVTAEPLPIEPLPVEPLPVEPLPVEPLPVLPSQDNDCIFTYVQTNECTALDDYSPHELKQIKLDNEQSKASAIMESMYPGLY